MSWLMRWWAGLSPRQVDLLLAVGLAAVVALAALASDESGATESAPAAWTLGAALGALVLLRRRWPVGVLVASIATSPRSGRAGRWSWRSTPAPWRGG